MATLEERTVMKEQISPTSPFWDLIPYVHEKLCIETSRSNYPFWTNEQFIEIDIRDHDFIAGLIACISLFSTLTQFAFFVSGPTPYRWISFAFWLSCQLFHMLWMFTYALSTEKDERWWYRLLMAIQIFVTPVLPFTWIHLMSISLDAHYAVQSLLMKSLLSITTTIIQAIPQIIILTILITTENMHLFVDASLIINLSYIASMLSIIGFCVVISSIFEYKYAFILNALWLMLDFVIVIFILTVLMYDSSVLWIFYIDIGVFGVCVFLVLILANLRAIRSNVVRSNGIMMAYTICCSTIAFVFVVPLLCFMHMITLFPFSILEQVYNVRIFPFNIRMFDKEKVNDWYDYIIYEWIMQGNNTQERDNRLCCANMVIMDTETKYNDKKYAHLKDSLARDIKQSMQFNTDTVKSMKTESKFNFNGTLIDSEYSAEYQNEKAMNIMFKCNLLWYFISRVVHLITPVLLILYMNTNYIENIIQVLIYAIATLFGLCIVFLCIAIYCLYYYKLILRIHDTTDFTKIKIYIANCHGQLGSLKALIDWCNKLGGNRDIANVIFALCYANEHI